MTYLDMLNEILSMTPKQRLQEVKLYEDFGMFGDEPTGKVLSEVKVKSDKIVAIVE
jgi:hypothetical protein